MCSAQHYAVSPRSFGILSLAIVGSLVGGALLGLGPGYSSIPMLLAIGMQGRAA